MENSKSRSTLFQNKDFVLLLGAQTVSNIGDWLHILALFTLVALKWNGSPLMMTGIMLCLTVPGILFGSIAGVIADRLERKTLMVLADFARFLIVLGIAFSTNIWEIYLLLILLSLSSNLFNPAKSGKLKELVSDSDMQAAVSYSEMINNSAKILGPAIGGLFVASLGINWAFYVDAFSFVISAALLFFIKKRMIPFQTNPEKSDHEVPKVSGKKGWLKDLSEGLSLMKKIPLLITGLTILSAVFMILQISDSQAMILIRKVQGQPIHLAGYCMAASGAGMLAASAFLSRKTLRSHFLTLVLSPVIIGVALLFAGLFINLPTGLILCIYPFLFFLAGTAFSFAVIPFEVLSQQKIPVEFTGRVFGTINSVTTFAVIIGLLLGGLLTELKGPIFTYILSGTLLIILGLSVLLYRKKIEGREHHGAESLERTL